MDPRTQHLLKLWHTRGNSRYGGEAVSQLQHALQTAWLAEQEGASPALVTAALLHDVGHVLHQLPEDAPDQDIDDVHEQLGARWLVKHFPDEVSEPVRLHVMAKRYLCYADQDYYGKLSAPSRQSLELQGGPLDATAGHEFEQHPHFAAAIRLRRWDEQAKDPHLVTPPIEHFIPAIEQSLMPETAL